MNRIVHIVGARPNFMKAAPVISALALRGNDQVLVHTGQHYDANMSEVFFRQLGMPMPDFNLEAGSGSHAVQTAEIMVRVETVLSEQKPDWLVVYGDVNSTIAASLVAAKLGVRVAHVEAGLRSWDRTMPEEINRILTDRLCDLLFTPSVDGNNNLKMEGITDEKIQLVGNVMIDTLIRLQPQADTLWPKLSKDLAPDRFVLATLHRPSNVDDPAMLSRILDALIELSHDVLVIFPVHPRTRQRLKSLGFPSDSSLRLVEPLGYLEFLSLQQHAEIVITDSGGIQEETTFLGRPCLTLRENTERPITVSLGTNMLIGRDTDKMLVESRKILMGYWKKGSVPPLWDGCTGERIASILS